MNTRTSPFSGSLTPEISLEALPLLRKTARRANLQGDCVGLTELEAFFATLASQTDGTFRVTPVSVTPVGDERLVMQTRNTMILAGERIETDVVLVWQIVDGRISEVWSTGHMADTGRR